MTLLATYLLGIENPLQMTAQPLRVPIEIKSSMTFGKNLVHDLELYCDADKAARKPKLIGRLDRRAA